MRLDSATNTAGNAVHVNGETRRLGGILIKQGKASPQQIHDALERQSSDRGPAKRLGELLVESGQIDAAAVIEALVEQAQLERVDLEHVPIQPEAIRLLPADVATHHQTLPLALRGRVLRTAMADPFDAQALEALRVATGKRIERVYCPPTELAEAIRKTYGSNVARMIADLDPGMESEDTGTKAPVPDEGGGESVFELEQMAREPSVVNLVNLIILEAVEARASDVHIEPFEKVLRVKYRIDGLLQEMPPPPRRLYAAIVSRIKIMGGMDIAERFVPQDGHISFQGSRGTVDIRVGTVPTVFGESVALRLLDRSVGLIDLERIGFPANQLTRFCEMLELPHGIVLVTGPTGSGKTTTLYASLSRIFTPEKKIITIEDPVEYQLDGVNQIPVNRKRGLDFAGGLRAILRQDPDIIMVGEIRDRETADIAIRAALTGHLVFSTLHTNDAAGAVGRLLDMGVEPFLLASSLEGVLAQRLVRRICPHCKQPYQPAAEMLARMGGRVNSMRSAVAAADSLPQPLPEGGGRESEADGRFFAGEGCRQCRQTGYMGRTGLFELLSITDPVRQVIHERGTASEVLTAAGEDHQTMREHGLEKAAAGQTTVQEVLRVTQDSPAEEAIGVD